MACNARPFPILIGVNRDMRKDPDAAQKVRRIIKQCELNFYNGMLNTAMHLILPNESQYSKHKRHFLNIISMNLTIKSASENKVR
jgi:hypothetical protein